MRVLIVQVCQGSENPSAENRVVESDIEQLRADGVELDPYISDSEPSRLWKRHLVGHARFLLYETRAVLAEGRVGVTLPDRFAP